MLCPKCNGTMEENHVKTYLVWIDIVDQIPDKESQGPTIAYVCSDCGYMEFYQEISHKKNTKAPLG